MNPLSPSEDSYFPFSSPEVVCHILSFLSPLDRLRFGLVCSQVRPLALDEIYWRNRVKHLPSFSRNAEPQRSFEIYFQSQRLQKNLAQNNFTVSSVNLVTKRSVSCNQESGRFVVLNFTTETATLLDLETQKEISLKLPRKMRRKVCLPHLHSFAASTEHFAFGYGLEDTASQKTTYNVAIFANPSKKYLSNFDLPEGNQPFQLFYSNKKLFMVCRAHQSNPLQELTLYQLGEDQATCLDSGLQLVEKCSDEQIFLYKRGIDDTEESFVLDVETLEKSNCSLPPGTFSRVIYDKTDANRYASLIFKEEWCKLIIPCESDDNAIDEEKIFILPSKGLDCLWGDNFLWVIDDSGNVYKIDPITEEIAYLFTLESESNGFPNFYACWLNEKFLICTEERLYCLNFGARRSEIESDKVRRCCTPEDLKAWDDFEKALQSEDVESIRASLQQKPDLIKQFSYGNTALHLCVQQSKLTSLRYLLEFIKENPQFKDLLFLTNTQGNTPFYCACQLEDRQVQSLLVNAMEEAACLSELERLVDHDLESAHQFIALRPDLVHMKNGEGITPLYYACLSGNFEIARTLIANGADVNVKNGEAKLTALDAALNKKDLKMIFLLLEKGARISYITALHEAIFEGDAERAERLLYDFPILFSIKSGEDITPLYYACGAYRSLEIARILIAYGAEVNAVNGSAAKSALDVALDNGDTEIIELLLRNGAQIFKTE